MDSTQGLLNVWAQGDTVSRAVLLLLLAMSLASWIVIALKALDLRLHAQQARRVNSFWHAGDMADGMDRLGTEIHNPFRQLAETGREASAHLLAARDNQASRQLHDALDVSDWVTRALRNTIDEALARSQNGLAVLASVGSTAPFVGLFGTVWGIYHALLSIGVAGQATIDRVAGPIGEALIMTALGLAVAIPAVLGYNALVRGNKAFANRLNRFAHDLHAFYVTGSRVAVGNPSNVLPIKKA